MKFIFSFLLGLTLSTSIIAQENYGFRVYFKDKGTNLELMYSPTNFLSSAAIERRVLQNIPITDSDLPIASEYILAMKELGGEVLAHSKWLNYIYIQSVQPEEVMALPFVDHIEYPRKHKSLLTEIQSSDTLSYGFATGQIEMVNGHLLHQAGFTGTGITIAVIDAGYEGFVQSVAFDSLRDNQRLLGSYNFISGDTNVFSGWGSHGASVLSVMAAHIPDSITGMAPHANYWLFTTENVFQETPLEMDHWIMAAEFADSVGAHVINSSLSYRVFDDPQYDFVYSDMDGNTAAITRAADMAASKGILVVSSAGNEGANPYPYIAVPADGDSVLTIGAVSWQGDYAPFSSIGPTADGRVKPDVVAQGSPTTVINSQGQVDISFGTSFSSPLIAGLSACLIEAYPAMHSEEIANMIRQSGSTYTSPSDTLGYGLPDFQMAFNLSSPEYVVRETNFSIYPNPANQHLIIDAKTRKDWISEIRIYDLKGQQLYSERISAFDAYRLPIDLQPGMYILQMEGDLEGVFRFQKM